MQDLVVIEDGTILGMINDTAFESAIPCLSGKRDIFKHEVIHCGSCAAKRRSRQRNTMAQIKSCLAALSPDKRAELKRLLNTKQVRVTFTNASGQVVQLTF